MKVRMIRRIEMSERVDVTDARQIKQLENPTYFDKQAFGWKYRGQGWIFKLGLRPYPDPKPYEYVWVRGRHKQTKTGLSNRVFAYAKVLPKTNKWITRQPKEEGVKVKLLFNREIRWVGKDSVFVERG